MITSSVLKLALEECEKSSYHFRMGAVIFKGKRIISSGHNGVRTSSQIPLKHKNYLESLHAEQAAVMNLDWSKLKGCSILVIKISKTEKRLSNALPCPMCFKLLNHLGVKNIYYTNEEGLIIKWENPDE